MVCVDPFISGMTFMRSWSIGANSARRTAVNIRSSGETRGASISTSVKLSDRLVLNAHGTTRDEEKQGAADHERVFWGLNARQPPPPEPWARQAARLHLLTTVHSRGSSNFRAQAQLLRCQ